MAEAKLHVSLNIYKICFVCYVSTAAVVMCHTSRFCEWRLQGLHSPFHIPKWGRQQQVAVRLETPVGETEQTHEEWNKSLVSGHTRRGKITFWIRQRCQKWNKTQLIHRQANCLFFLKVEKFCGAREVSQTQLSNFTWLFSCGHKTPRRPAWHPCVCVTGRQESLRGARPGGKDQTPVSACFGKPSRRRGRANPAPPRPHKRPP